MWCPVVSCGVLLLKQEGVIQGSRRSVESLEHETVEIIKRRDLAGLAARDLSLAQQTINS
jgi:hypothetical protein